MSSETIFFTGLNNIMIGICNVIEAHCYALQGGQIDCEQLHGSINQQLIVGRFCHKGLRQLCTKLFCIYAAGALYLSSIGDFCSYTNGKTKQPVLSLHI